MELQTAKQASGSSCLPALPGSRSTPWCRPPPQKSACRTARSGGAGCGAPARPPPGPPGCACRQRSREVACLCGCRRPGDCVPASLPQPLLCRHLGASPAPETPHPCNSQVGAGGGLPLNHGEAGPQGARRRIHGLQLGNKTTCAQLPHALPQSAGAGHAARPARPSRCSPVGACGTHAQARLQHLPIQHQGIQALHHAQAAAVVHQALEILGAAVPVSKVNGSAGPGGARAAPTPQAACLPAPSCAIHAAQRLPARPVSSPAALPPPRRHLAPQGRFGGWHQELGSAVQQLGKALPELRVQQQRAQQRQGNGPAGGRQQGPRQLHVKQRSGCRLIVGAPPASAPVSPPLLPNKAAQRPRT